MDEAEKVIRESFGMNAGEDLIQRDRLGVLTKIESGQTGVVYRAPNVRINVAPLVVFKEYRTDFKRQVNFDQLRKMVGVLESLSKLDGERLLDCTAWPLANVYDGNGPCGFLMPEVPSEFFIDLNVPSGKKRRALSQVQLLFNSESFLARRGIVICDRDRFELLANAAQTLEFLHQRKVSVGDLSPNNLLFSLQPRRRCYFIDADAMAVDGRSVLPQLETDDWMVRSVSAEPLGTMESDRFKLALFAIRLFALSQDSSNVRSMPVSVPNEIRHLAERGVSIDPRIRPRAVEWIEPSIRAAKSASTDPPRPKAGVVGGRIQTPQVDSSGALNARPLNARTNPVVLPPAMSGQRPVGVTQSPARSAATNSASQGRRRQMATWSLTSAIWTSIYSIVLVGGLASVLGSPWAATTLQTTAASIPYVGALKFLLGIALSTCIPAVIISVGFDVCASRANLPGAAIKEWPNWHRNIVMAAAVLGPSLYFAIHWGEKFGGGSPFGPPREFWYIAPVLMLSVHTFSLLIRLVRK
jgi:hypothetical protein